MNRRSLSLFCLDFTSFVGAAGGLFLQSSAGALGLTAGWTETQRIAILNGLLG